MSIQLNPTTNDTFETKTLAQLRQMVLDGLGFISPNNLGVSGERTLLDLRTDIKNRLGLATPMPVVTDTLLNIRTDLYNMLGFAAMGTHPPGVDTMLNAFINQAQQFLFRALELDKGTATAPTVMAADGSTCVLDRDAILRVALGNAKARYRQADAQIYLAEAKKYVDDLKGRAPPNIDNLVNAALQDAERVVANRIEFSDFWVAGAPPVYGLNSADTSKTIIDAEPIFLLALANLKASFKQDDAKAIGEQFETYLKNMVQRRPPNAKLVINRLLKDAQQYLFRLYDVFRMERWFSWTTVAGQRFYSVQGDDGGPMQPPTGVSAVAGAANGLGNMSNARFLPAIAVLPNGTVLVAGGNDGVGDSQTADIYNPATQSFTPTGNMLYPVTGARAVTLQDGRVLICGGQNDAALANAQIYDYTTGTFSYVQPNTPAPMNVARQNHTATLLANGTVLIAGGQNATGALTAAEIFDPATNVFRTTGVSSLVGARFSHSATLLPSGKVLMAGGATNASNKLTTAEIFDPATGVFTSTTGSLGTARSGHAAVLLSNGRVLLVSGGTTGLGNFTTTCELYLPSSDTFTGTGAVATARSTAGAVRLANGNVLVTGGSTGQTTSEIYSTSAGTFSAGPAMITASESFTVRLNTSDVLVAGGSNGGSTFYASAQLYVAQGNTFKATGTLCQGTNYYRVVAINVNGSTLPSTEVNVTVGASVSVTISWSAEANTTVTGYQIYGRAQGAEQLIATVSASTLSYTDTGTIVPSGALPTVNTTAGNGAVLDPRAITWVGASSGDNTWRELIEGIDPLQYNGTLTGPPQRYEIRQGIELWPTPADSTWLLRVKGYFVPGSFDNDTDVNSIDWQPIYFKALADAKRFYKQPDADKIDLKLLDYVKRLVAGTHKTARYIPGNIPIRNTPPRPVIV